MNDEIKEILREMKKMCEIWVKVDGNIKSYNQDQIHCIYDYITSLQEENERLKVELNKYKAKQKLENDIKMQQSYLDYYRTMTRGDKE